MATFILNRQDRIPVGTNVDAYRRTTDNTPSAFEAGQSVATEAMTSTGAEFTGLDRGRYWFVADVDDNQVVIAGTAGEDVNPPPWLTGQAVPEVTGAWPNGSPGVALCAALAELGLIEDNTTEAA